MPAQLTPEAAAAALADIASARTAMRHAIRAHRGHYHLWLWGVIWIAMPLWAYFRGDDAARYFGWLCVPGIIGSFVIGAVQARQIRGPINPRFLGVIVALAFFFVVFPVVLHARPDARQIYTYVCLCSMLGYIIAGLWTDTYLLWVGVIVTLLILTGFFFFPGFFWLWMAVFGGGTLVLTGFYVRHFWR
jgi:hypothetical protein